VSEKRSSRKVPRSARQIHEEAPPKLREIAACPLCGASYRAGRWTWQKAPAGYYEHVCAACSRIEAGQPAASLHVGGEFVAQHRADLIGLIRNLEERERSEHPLKRIMEIRDEGTGFVVTVTDPKLAHTFGKGLKRAFDGKLELPPTSREQENTRVTWTRD
jgi:hypothetical protein